MGVKRRRAKGSFATDEALAALAKDQEPPGPEALEDSRLFTLDDTPADFQHASPYTVKRHRAGKQKRSTRVSAIIAAACEGKPMVKGSAYAPRKKALAQKAQRLGTKSVSARKHSQPRHTAAQDTMSDIWGESEEKVVMKAASWLPERPPPGLPGAMHALNRPGIPAVEVDKPGCSFNPDPESHQDAIAEAVAAEMAPIIDAALRPPSVPLRITPATYDEMAQGLFGGDECVSPLGMEATDAGNPRPARRAGTRKRKGKDKLKEARKRAAEDALARQRALKAMRRDIDSVKDLGRRLDETEQAQCSVRERRQADLFDKACTLPPRLGRHRFVPPKLQVLATEDATGSLRTLKTTPQVATDRFKSLQQRGVVQVTVKQHYNKPTTRRMKAVTRSST